MNRTSPPPSALLERNRIFVRQVHEIAELFGYETRNKYQISDENKNVLAFAAEDAKSLIGFLLRQVLGHWRVFNIHFFDSNRQRFLTAHHPFRWFFERIEVQDGSGRPLGAIQKKFSILTKRFEVENSQGQILMEVASPLWKIWTFNFERRGRTVASVQKKWSGLFSEALTDRDNFLVEFNDPALSPEERQLVLAAALFVDIVYFERKE